MRANVLVLSALGLAVLGLPLAGCGSSEEVVQESKAPSGPRLVLQASDTADWQDVSAAVATVDQSQVLARIPGILTTLSVREGDMVRRGQTIGRIVDNQLVHQAAAYKAQMVQAQAELKRVKFLHDNGVYADARLEQAQAAASASRAQYAAASSVSGQGAVVAPASGRVLRADVPAGSPVAPGMVIAVVTAGPTIVRLEMPESLAGKVHPGSQVKADGIGGEDNGATGRVIKVYPSVTAGHVMADVQMPGIDDKLIGRRVAASVETGGRKALLVPTRYVTQRYGIDYVMLVAKDGTATEVPVQTAPSSEKGKVEILSGVSAGDTLVATGSGAAEQ
ncbi:efflux RND transporter periplasmic adaptor subunit [Novosphingobium mangrovi (ex Huang et al. 2023)]|uniref:Efflux RND transporter periplasmic adaptor subunit n=1 Tax=Novosphingobium mangrovi (ex Huang et al. 2023) TaxID=2976432 RepID=A0ABT2I558_9SPHN|nr:efflux RND transporter periplasmic adaptor subunit [Novosphingobium mangrovi (ex Huang et al. 2023)]MCT2399947.1 efflux RND transporter periplasmic adaptor subunit [Novosphingobium mangrovi (ex Huang et al. 2023)]